MFTDCTLPAGGLLAALLSKDRRPEIRGTCRIGDQLDQRTRPYLAPARELHGAPAALTKRTIDVGRRSPLRRRP